MIVSQTLAIARNTFREAVRDRVLYNLVAFAVILIASALLFGQISIGIQKTILINIGLSCISVFGLLIAVFLGIGLVYKEVDKRSLYPLLSKPIRRWQFVVGKYLGLNLTLVVNTFFMSLGLWATLYYLVRQFQPQDQYIWAAIYLILLQLCLLTAVCLFFSCLSTPVLSAIFTVLLYVIGSFSSDMKVFGELAQDRGVQIVMTFLYYVLPNFSDFQVLASVSHGLPVPAKLLLLNTAYTVLYGGALLGAATLIFSRKDLK